MTILTSSTQTALWQSIVHKAEAECSIVLQEDLEAYLVFLLMRYINQSDLLHECIAPLFLRASQLMRDGRRAVLQEVGDRCLLLSGLFPMLVERRLVKVSYFVRLGQTAYHAVSKKQNDLYELLSNQFVPMMDVLQSLRHAELSPMYAYELWNETGSQHALNALKKTLNGLPILSQPSREPWSCLRPQKK